MAVVNVSSFDRIAFAYDFLAQLVFGNNIQEAQCAFLHKIPEGSRVLIIGGGTGWIIPQLFRASAIHELVYIEASEQMIKRAKSKTNAKNKNKTTFILGTEQNLFSLGTFDVVITFFFLDLFTPAASKEITAQLYQSLKSGGLWLVSDFEYDLKKGWQRLLVRCMYLFFRIFCRISSRHLNDTKELFEELQLQTTEEKLFFHNMIFSSMYYK